MKKTLSCILLVSFYLSSVIWAQGEPDSASDKTVMQEHFSFAGWPNCIRLSNGSIELIITTDIGPRILRFGFINEQNMFYVSPSEKGKTGGDEWHLYGGHRFWLAPEIMPRTYSPDNTPVSYSWDGKTLKLVQDIEPETKTVKEIEIRLFPEKNEVEVLHRLINKGKSEVELAPWAISACAAGGRAIVPHEPYIDPADFMLPARPIVLWAYTKMNDPRYSWGEKFIIARQDTSISSETKIGVLNKQQWAAYYLNGFLFTKKFEYNADALYTDYGCNNEIYINGDFLEVETLGPVSRIAPEDSVEHLEHWFLFKTNSIKFDLSQISN